MRGEIEQSREELTEVKEVAEQVGGSIEELEIPEDNSELVEASCRTSAKTYNFLCGDGLVTKFVKVPFMDGQMPEDRVHQQYFQDLAAIRNLSDGTALSIYRKYRGRGSPDVTVMKAFIEAAVGYCTR